MVVTGALLTVGAADVLVVVAEDRITLTRVAPAGAFSTVTVLPAGTTITCGVVDRAVVVATGTNWKATQGSANAAPPAAHATTRTVFLLRRFFFVVASMTISPSPG